MNRERRIPLTIRLWQPDDSISALTELIHRAYAKHTQRNLKFLAASQTNEITMIRINAAECWVGHAGERLVATILFYPPSTGVNQMIISDCDWYNRPDVAKFAQLAVDPDYQGRGYGSILLDLVERRARETGAAELACDTAEPADDLRRLYVQRGFRLVGTYDWRPKTNYMSVVYSKTVTP
jgi:GNAT superfamily N-acetyltransferase